VKFDGVDELNAAFLNESRNRGRLPGAPYRKSGFCGALISQRFQLQWFPGDLRVVIA
jgi:hypothetical protein